PGGVDNTLDQVSVPRADIAVHRHGKIDRSERFAKRNLAKSICDPRSKPSPSAWPKLLRSYYFCERGAQNRHCAMRNAHSFKEISRLTSQQHCTLPLRKSYALAGDRYSIAIARRVPHR